MRPEGKVSSGGPWARAAGFMQYSTGTTLYPLHMQHGRRSAVSRESGGDLHGDPAKPYVQLQEDQEVLRVLNSFSRPEICTYDIL
ncbi:hypothetical protein RvY_00953-2 [Ramazzottius varieornatus]|uniref:Uncharacterized protein n=1 Tax=Ramazzottius varieornatus TaxID=947166 RepID=A0A1D1UPD2_RAMVA|nr:hypothetical protein RvY_00953-2 [Ramazzottius varieornatus]